MALISCPECNKEISDKVKACPHCGYPLIQDNDHDIISTPQQVEVTGVKIKTSNNVKKFAMIGLISLIGLVAIYFGVNAYNKDKAEKEYHTAFNTYIDNLQLAQAAMISGGSDAETILNLTSEVWRNAIYEEYDSATDKYTAPNGYFVSDFNTALANLFSSTLSSRTRVNIETSQELVQQFMKDLQNPPEGLERCYDTLIELNTAFTGLAELAKNPTGSLTSFSENKNKKISEFMDAYNKLTSQIPEKIEIAQQP